MGLRILKKIEAIVRDEMDKSGALEFELPILTPADIWQQSGRWEKTKIVQHWNERRYRYSLCKKCSRAFE